jgi:hypothetical protein
MMFIGSKMFGVYRFPVSELKAWNTFPGSEYSNDNIGK